MTPEKLQNDEMFIFEMLSLFRQRGDLSQYQDV